MTIQEQTISRNELHKPFSIPRILLLLRNEPILTTLFILGIFIRIYGIAAFPAGLNQDEASIGYDAFAILNYGIDRNGSFLPIHLIAWGSGQNALYAYFSMPFIWLFGLNAFSIRIVSALAGVATLFLFLYAAKRFIPNHRAAVIASFVIVICPWHIMMSRWALESNLLPALVLLAVCFALKALNNPKWLFAFSAVMAISLYAYGTAYFFVPLFVISIYALFIIKRLITVWQLAANVIAAFVLGIPIALFVLINRLSSDAIHAVFTIPKLTVPRVESVSSVFGSEMISSSFHNMKRFLEIIISQNDGLLWNAIPTYGYMYPIALPLIVLGLAVTAKLLKSKLDAAQLIIMLWLVFAISLGFILSDANINRINIVFYPLLLLTAAGLAWLIDKEKWLGRLAVVMLAGYFLFFTNYYFKEYPKQIGPMFFEGLGEAIQYASDATDGTVYITDKINMPYIYVLVNEKVNPHDFMDTVVYSNPGGAFQQVQSFGRYRFGQPVIQEGEKAAYLMSSGDALPEDISKYKVKHFKQYLVLTER
ncbi:glycosyltransferase family 39 protein [Paenibacillus sp. NEAU-GSW1]|uniref:ArnT family glycosyltransferase n=1 Tax=Paenibacillus sp. NEAU-GSW1 TaxID=2682486 RepID=UPI001564D7C8|nr:glycosyltransferase family 39 protein [Paenibacillus sp. NEAU-GSW1]